MNMLNCFSKFQQGATIPITILTQQINNYFDLIFKLQI
jgi:hypothetical protein